MARPRSVPVARCPDHPDGHVIAKGTYETRSGRRRRYRCTPLVGGVHDFSVIVVLALVIGHHRRTDMGDWAEKVAHYGWRAGSRHLEVAAAHAAVVAQPGRPSDLQAALDVINESLATRDGSTAPAWRHLTARRAHLAGLQRRAKGRPTGEFDDDGNPIIDPPHKPTNPIRTRRERFAV